MSAEDIARSQLLALTRDGKSWVDVLEVADSLRLPHVLKHAILAGLLTDEMNRSSDSIGASASPGAGGRSAPGVRAAIRTLVGSRSPSQPPARGSSFPQAALSSLPVKPLAPTGMVAAAATMAAASIGRSTSPSSSSRASAAEGETQHAEALPSRQEMMQRLVRERLGFEVEDLYKEVVSPALAPLPGGPAIGPTVPIPPPAARDYSDFLTPRSALAAASGTAFEHLSSVLAHSGYTPPAPIKSPTDSQPLSASPRKAGAVSSIPEDDADDDEAAAEQNSGEKPVVKPWPDWLTQEKKVERKRLSSGSSRARSSSDANLPRTSSLRISAVGSPRASPKDEQTGRSSPTNARASPKEELMGLAPSPTTGLPMLMTNPLKSDAPTSVRLVDFSASNSLPVTRSRSLSSAAVLGGGVESVSARPQGGDAAPVVLYETPMPNTFASIPSGPTVSIPDGVNPAMLYASPLMREATKSARSRARSKSFGNGLSGSPAPPASFGSPRAGPSSAPAESQAPYSCDSFSLTTKTESLPQSLNVSPITPEDASVTSATSAAPRPRYPGGFSPVASASTNTISPNAPSGSATTLSVVSFSMSAGVRLGADASSEKLLMAVASARESLTPSRESNESNVRDGSASRRIGGRAVFGYPSGGAPVDSSSGDAGQKVIYGGPARIINATPTSTISPRAARLTINYSSPSAASNSMAVSASRIMEHSSLALDAEALSPGSLIVSAFGSGPASVTINDSRVRLHSSPPSYASNNQNAPFLVLNSDGEPCRVVGNSVISISASDSQPRTARAAATFRPSPFKVDGGALATSATGSPIVRPLISHVSRKAAPEIRPASHAFPTSEVATEVPLDSATETADVISEAEGRFALMNPAYSMAVRATLNAGSASVLPDTVDTLKRHELSVALEARGLTSSGNTDELRARLRSTEVN